MKHLSKEQLELLSDPSMSAVKLSEILGAHPVTISRRRKKLGVQVPLGSKKGVPKEANKNGKMIPCKVCGTETYVPKYRHETHKYCSSECMWNDPDYRKKLSQVDKSYMQTESYRKSKSNPETPEFVKYRNRVHRLSQKTYEKYVDEINPNGYDRTLAGVDGGYQLDHIIEVRFGFDNNIPPEVLAEKENLRMLPWKSNLARNKKR